MKKNLFVFVLLFIGISTFAGIVPVETARKVAVNFYYERANAVKPIFFESVKITQEFTELQNNKPAYYIFNIGHDNGYIIVSAESNTIPVLAYSFEKNYYKDNVSPAFNWIVKSYKNEIIKTREKNLEATGEINELWATYTSSDLKSNTSMAAALLTTATWDQGCHYNELCPTATGGPCNHTPTGCVATAMAIIMKYYAWPTQGQGSYSYAHTIANGFQYDYGTLSANFGASTYNWAAMPANVTSSNAEVAKIMYHCGVAVEMEYRPTSSGAAVGSTSAGYPWPTAQKAFVNYFKYPTAAFFKKESFSDANWKAKIKTEIDASRPILYAGDDGLAGHAFVLDGYQGAGNDYYHFNFGWSGYADGYFYLTSITPNPGGTGGGSYDFTQNQEGIFNISHTTGIEETQTKASIEIYPNPSNGLFTINLSNITDLKTKLEVYNLIGEKVWEENVNKENTTLNLSFLPKGLYYLSVKSENKIITKKITIVK